MSLTPNFTVTQSFGTPTNLTFTDTSTGSDSSIASRNIYIQQVDGTYIVMTGNTSDYTTWDYDLSTITLDILTKDVAVTITIDWVDDYGVRVYTSTKIFSFTNFNEKFDYGTTQMLTANPMLINDNDFFVHKADMRVSIDSGNQAFNLVGDLFSAQQCYDRATNLRTSSQYYFNINS
jgi:hypothetical protein